jgi:sugar phosphate permease
MTCQNLGSILGQQISSLLLITFELRWEFGFLFGSLFIMQTGLVQYFYLDAKPDSEFEVSNISVNLTVQLERSVQMNQMSTVLDVNHDLNGSLGNDRDYAKV